jgi:helicase required for RNAi-mediated heterochromatin assembly 1
MVPTFLTSTNYEAGIVNIQHVGLSFENPEQSEIDPVMEFTMVEERSSFFEADRHTMKAVQKMMSEP